MKLKSLYSKLLLSFLGVLFITIILIFVLFIITAGRSYRHHMDKQSIAKFSILQKIVQAKLDRKPLVPISQNKDINELLHNLSDLFDVEIWLTAPDKTILIKTFSSPINIDIKGLKYSNDQTGGIKLYKLSQRRINYYAQIPIKFDKKINILHIYFNNKYGKKSEAVFLIGLLCIGAVIAILLIPLTRIITKRIKQLKESAFELADGNLSCRLEIQGHDEIAELGNSFNFMADKLEKMIEINQELTANISHELRSPLTRIKVSKELIQDKLGTSITQDIKRHIQSIDEDIDTLDDLIDKVLKLSKMDYHESSVSLEDINLNLFLKDIKKKYHPSLKQKNLTMVMDIQGGSTDPLVLNTDKNIFTSIISNLFDNAVKYSEKGGIIHIAGFKQAGKTLNLTITNTYQPLSPTELEKLFEPFFRIKGNKNPGSGLGLTIVKKQLKQLAGDIIAKNTAEGLSFQMIFKI